jgi:hypothetical protein
VGKTALLRYFRQRINSDWGRTEFNGQFSAVVVYVGFRSQVDRRYMEQLALSALVDVCKNGVLDASRAALRLNAIPEDKVDAILADESEGTEGADNLLNDLVLNKHGVISKTLDESVTSTLISAGVEVRVAQALGHGAFEDYLRSMRKDGALEPLYVPRDTKILDYSRMLAGICSSMTSKTSLTRWQDASASSSRKSSVSALSDRVTQTLNTVSSPVSLQPTSRHR